MGNPLSRFVRSLSRGCVSWTLVVLAFWPFLALPVAAQGGPTTVIADLPRVTNNFSNNILTVLSRVAMVGFFNAAQTFLGQLAFDAADYIATGGSGQSATYYKKSIGKYLEGVASDAVGEFIGSLSNESFFRTAGFDLCRPSARQLLRLQLSLGNFFPGMQGRFQRPRPRCEFQSIIRNYDTLYQTLSNGDVLKNIQFSVNTNSSDLGVAFNILGYAQKKSVSEAQIKAAERAEGGGFKSITNFLSGTIKTPAQVVNESARETLVKFPKASLLTTIGATLSSGMSQGFEQLALYTASMFVNTLTSKLLRRVFETGLDDGVAQLQLSADQITQTRPNDTRNVATSLKTPNLQKVETFDVVTELATCPSETRGTWNCTIDQGLRSSLVRTDRGGVTIRSALASNLLHGNWSLIPVSDVRRNQDRECYTRGYCAGNLQKLRVLRMIPVGFELAANSAENIRRCSPQGGGCVTLQEVVDGFNTCDGTSASPWCHLIDPDWILAALPQQCVLKGYGEQLLSSTLGQRREECQDVQTCLRRNDQGECVGGYGYCVAEKSVYRFGADECLPRQASCRSYQTRGGEDVSYLRNTTDRATCSADNVGCLWYATTRDPERGAEAWIGTTSTGPRVYFNAKIDTCASSAEGCTKVFEAVSATSSLNLVINPSFEKQTDATPPVLMGWKVLSSTARPLPWASNNVHQDGELSADLNVPTGGSVNYLQSVALNAAHSYVLSFSARLKTATPSGRVSVFINEFSDTLGRVSVFDPRTFKSSGCAVIPGVRSTGIFVPTPGRSLLTDWQRFECTFVTTSSTKAGILMIGDVLDVLYGENRNALIDNVQLEEGEYATNFVDGMNMSLVERHLKIAPDDFACSGESDDPVACDTFAKVCRQIEAGCNGYTDTVTGGNQIPAILSVNNLCPATCVGYAEYRKSASAFDLVKETNETLSDATDDQPNYFIPSTATSCRRQDVGCEAFTNVEGALGESQAYLTYARSCRKPSASSQTFFTWEGSDTSGYQLRTWSLVQDTATPPAPLIFAKREPGSQVIKRPTDCNATSWPQGLDPDCRQFYDADGHVSYRYYSQTVLSTTACQDFRMARSSADDCTKTGGVFDAVASECLYHIYLPQSQLCTASAVGCREYRGVTSGASLPILQESFRGVTSTQGFSGARLSDESLLVGDQSLWLYVPAVSGASVSSTFISPVGDHQYSVTFWAKAAVSIANLQVNLRDPADVTHPPVMVGNSVRLTADWQRYTVGPFFGYPGVATSTLVWTASGNRSAYVVFLDEVSLIRIQDRTYVRRDTWQTPAVCDQNAYGVPQPQAMLGCRTYRSRESQAVHVKDFTRLCREVAIGCKAFVDTRNSTDVGEQIFERGDTPTIPGFGAAITKRAADRMRYLIDDPAARCTRAEDSCRAVGKPVFSADRINVSRFTTMYIKDDITRYEQLLCRPSELFCDQFTHDGSNEYFRDPDNHICEYREQLTNVADAPPGGYSGWFEVGSNPPVSCYPTLLESGQAFGIARRADPMYRGWVGLCEPEAAECTELRDPVDTSDPARPSGKPYFFIRNEHLNVASCAGRVDRANGCVLMRDTMSEDNRYNARATYATQQAMPRPTPILPIDCVRNPTDPTCRVQTGTCEGTIRYCATALACREAAVPVSFPATGEVRGNVWPMSLVNILWHDQPTVLNLLRCHTDADCIDEAFVPVPASPPTSPPTPPSYYQRTGSCKIENDANLIVKVNIDRDCAQWLGCSSSEVVFDPATNRSRSLCTNVALCDKGRVDTGDQYCEGYVNRASTSTEPVLTKGLAFTQPVYINRDIGLGQKDYSGYAIPNAFLPIDMVNARVAIDGTGGDTRATGKYARDYRLVSAVSMPPAHHPRQNRPPVTDPACAGRDTCFDHNQPALPNQAEILDRRSRLGAAYPSLHLCQHIQTKLIGYFIPNEANVTSTSVCYLASSFDPLTISDPSVRRSPYDFNSLALGFTQTDARNDAFVARAFPVAECRANPEADSPFDGTHVTAWDLTKNPPKPTQRAPGFSRVNVCEYGQDCSCTYKRADYSDAAVSKFFEPNAQSVPSGVCVGGPRDGEACIPGAVSNTGGDSSGRNISPPIPSPTAGQPATLAPERKRAAEASNASQTCGDAQLGGRCVMLSRVETVRGVFAQCLERDVTRGVNIGSTTQEPCLTWNPGAILFGEHDTYHYTPSAGYQPPPGSGAYYCLSPTRKSTTMRFDASDLVGQEPPPAIGLAERLLLGNLRNGDSPPVVPFSGRMTKISYDDDFVSRETENASGFASITGEGSKDGQSARDCEQADDEQDYDNQPRAPRGLRLVGTGAGRSHSYTEAFFQINGPKYVKDLFPNIVGVPTDSDVKSGVLESNIGYMKIQPFENPNGIGRLGCGYQADWVDGMPAVDYDAVDSLRTGDTAWRQKFFSNYNPLMTRGSEKMLTQDPAGYVIRPCVKTKNSPSSNATCGFKYWELGYRSEGQSDLFKGVLNPAGLGLEQGFEGLRRRAFAGDCSAEKPYFGIRGVFQSPAPSSDSIQAPNGPWEFIGFWVASCAGKANDVRYMYMHVDVVSADICKELAEVRSKDSLQDAAYTDRVWKEAAYTAPGIGTQYSSKFSPFASVVTSRPLSEAGTEPLFQTGADIAGYSPIKPPTFLAPGSESYYRPNPLPKDKWAYLSNLFARVYRVYRYYDKEVTVADSACLDGPFKGQACTPTSALTTGVAHGPSAQCSIQGVCDTSLLETGGVDSFKICDAMSGLNAGLSCADDPDMCHTGATFFDAAGAPRQKLHACIFRGGHWAQSSEGTYDDRRTAPVQRLTAAQASQFYVSEQGSIDAPFVCAGGMRGALGEEGSIRRAGDCSAPSPASRECPEEVLGKCVVPPRAVGGVVPPLDRPTPFTVRGGQDVSNAVTTTKCALPRYVSDRDPLRPEATHIARANVSADGYNNLLNPNRTYVDGDNKVYDVVADQGYTSCQADYDCSFTPYNYYMKRTGGYPPLYSVRSRQYMLWRGDWVTNYGNTSVLTGCLDEDRCMSETSVDVAACEGGERGTGGIYTGGMRRAATLLPRILVSDDPRVRSVTDLPLQNAYTRSHIVGVEKADLNYCAIQAWRLGTGGTSGILDQTNACGSVGTGTAYYQDTLYDDQLISYQGLASEITPRVLSELTRNPGVASTGFSTPATSDGFTFSIGNTPVTGCFVSGAQWLNIPFATCASPKDLSKSKAYGRCRGGLKDGSLCRVGAGPRDPFTCEQDLSQTTIGAYETAVNRCGPVSTVAGRTYTPVPACRVRSTDESSTDPRDPDTDNNICTHAAGYKPRVDLCPDPSDEFCGLIAYKRGNASSLTPEISPFPLATDVTMGHYTPDFLLGGAEGAAFFRDRNRLDFKYINYYRPYPPQVAALDSTQCRESGQCSITRAQAFGFNGQTEGPLVMAGGQHKSTIQFYAWAAHNQMPIRRMMIDWGDGFMQSLPDAKIKNHKPYCGGTKECTIVAGPNRGPTGLTCNVDNDCPSGYGRCENTGTCTKQADKSCSQDSDCTAGGSVGDRCNIRQFFGNSADACEQNYFEFSHIYTCEGERSVVKSTCSLRDASAGGEGAVVTTLYRCGRNPERSCNPRFPTVSCGGNDVCLLDLAPKGGCWQGATQTCRFTPRVLIEDNWGWCTGECRTHVRNVPGVDGAPSTNEIVDDVLGDATLSGEMSRVAHPFGGCYSGIPVNGVKEKNEVMLNTDGRPLTRNECTVDFPDNDNYLKRPWIVYPGSLQLRSR